MNDPIKIAVAGLGTVGAGVLELLAADGDMLAARCGRSLKVSAVSARDKGRDRGISLDGCAWFDDPVQMAADADAEVIVELIGGSENPALAVCEAAIAAGRHVVTANKALIAHHGINLARAAEKAGVALAYEAAVAGGIPIIKTIREGLAGNQISRIYGILNGTCNYILSQMRESGREFDDVLKEAQELGYAEADPSLDIDGVDSAHKLSILAAVAFGREIDFDAVYTEGIRGISLVDIRFAEELGYKIKLLGIAAATDDGIEQRVHPCMVPKDTPIATVEGVFNAIVADGDFIDTLMQEGRGAGRRPTASAVAADIVDIARGNILPVFSVPTESLKPKRTAPMAKRLGSYYIRLMVVDRPGIFAEIAASLRDHNVSMESVLQHGHAPGCSVPVVLTTHDTEEAGLLKVLGEVQALEAVVEPPYMIRIEHF